MCTCLIRHFKTIETPLVTSAAATAIMEKRPLIRNSAMMFRLQLTQTLMNTHEVRTRNATIAGYTQKKKTVTKCAMN